ncbi:SH3 domain-containing protein [Candidatus Absconditicoccus praedator]|uniref:SH3 domain-containing protein n=1 Tax=Candidatus Absconditicoccus praedator TaxID=2735562 RepID=UPI001E347150|nr:SH3 domain-containing protein [Candidatus Absconditicoccus praedator]UFX83336.1 SH3 domain-containing protein [Candidatus Absconditicoccus praedator]
MDKEVLKDLNKRTKELRDFLENNKFLIDSSFIRIDSSNLDQKIEELKSAISQSDSGTTGIIIHKNVGKPLKNILISDLMKNYKKQQKINFILRYSYFFVILLFVITSVFFIYLSSDDSIHSKNGINDFDYQQLERVLSYKIEKDPQNLDKFLLSVDKEFESFDKQEFLESEGSDEGIVFHLENLRNEIGDMHDSDHQQTEEDDIDEEDTEDEEEQTEEDDIDEEDTEDEEEQTEEDGIDEEDTEDEEEQTEEDDIDEEDTEDEEEQTEEDGIDEEDTEDEEEQTEEDDIDEEDAVDEEEQTEEDDIDEEDTEDEEEQIEISEEQEEVHQQIDESDGQAQIEVVTVVNINLRDGPGTSNQRLLTIPSGEYIQIFDYAYSEGEAWYQTNYQGTDGWISWIGIDDPQIFE